MRRGLGSLGYDGRVDDESVIYRRKAAARFRSIGWRKMMNVRQHHQSATRRK